MGNDVNVVFELAAVTRCVAVPALPAKLLSPSYVAVIVFDPANVNANEQFPAATVPTHVFPLASLTVTVTLPLGVPFPGLVTVTV